MCVSVEPGEGRIDFHGCPQHAVERSARAGPLEALQAAAGVDAPSRPLRSGLQRAAPRNEALELALRGLAPAARAGPDRLARHSPSFAGSCAASDCSAAATG